MRRPRDKKLTKIKLPSFLACSLWKTPDMKSNLCWAYRKLHNMKSTLVYQLWWRETKKKVSIISRKKFGGNCKGGRADCCLKQGERS